MEAPARRLRSVLAMAALAAGVASPCHADTVASLLGNFTTNQYVGARVAPGQLDVHYVVVLGQLPALRELHLADADRDGVTTDAERDAHARTLASTWATRLVVNVDGVAVPLRAQRWRTALPTEQGGFSLRIDAEFSAPLSASNGAHVVTLANDNYPGQFGWQEIVVAPAPGVSIYDTNVFSTSLTAALTETVTSMPASGPLGERAVRLSYTTGPMPPGALPIAAREGAAAAGTPAVIGNATDTSGSTWIARQTRAIVDAIAAPDASPRVWVWSLLAAMLLGALHAFSPGHGKSVVGAYLIGSRATARHAAFLGLTVTITHTLGVFALGFATLLASAYVVPERIFPILGLASGLIVAVMGATLAVQRWPAARAAWRTLVGERVGSRVAAHAFRSLTGATPLAQAGGSYVMASMHAHHAQGVHAGAAGWHSHGGTWHSHLPPGADGDAVTWRSLAALGVSGGLVPCPSAMVLLLAAIAINRTVFGLALVVAFSVGLALTLIAIGLVFLHARERLRTRMRSPRWMRVLPFGSAVLIALVGIALCYAAVTGGPV